jgi:hypothetical protein
LLIVLRRVVHSAGTARRRDGSEHVEWVAAVRARALGDRFAELVVVLLDTASEKEVVAGSAVARSSVTGPQPSLELIERLEGVASRAASVEDLARTLLDQLCPGLLDFLRRILVLEGRFDLDDRKLAVLGTELEEFIDTFRTRAFATFRFLHVGERQTLPRGMHRSADGASGGFRPDSRYRGLHADSPPRNRRE